MFPRLTSVRRPSGKLDQYIQLAESYRDQQGRTRQRVIVSLGRKDLLSAQLGALLRLLDPQRRYVASDTLAAQQAPSLEAFVEEAIQPGSLVHTDGWEGYAGLENKGYRHEVTVLRGKRQSASKLLPRVHRVASLLKRWLLGTHQGAVSHEYLNYYLDEFRFRFNRRTSRSRGKLFYRLLQQAVAADPAPYKTMVEATWAGTPTPKM